MGGLNVDFSYKDKNLERGGFEPPKEKVLNIGKRGLIWTFF